MKVLLLGGTGAMGVPLRNYLSMKKHYVFVTSRKQRKSENEYVHYLLGDAKEQSFLAEILKERFDVIVDFMHYTKEEFDSRKELILKATDHYFFLSSSRVYASSKSLLDESSNRLLDVVDDMEYLATDEYALSKARCEDALIRSGYKNYTILRPYITYNTDRIQLGMFEKNVWLSRALRGKSIVFAKDIAQRKTTLTYGDDVAKAIATMAEKKKGLGEIVQITCSDFMTWEDVLNLYLAVIEEEKGNKPAVFMIDESAYLSNSIGNTYKWKYDRSYDRVFDNSKIMSICGNDIEFVSMRKGLREVLKKALKNNVSDGISNIKVEAFLDRCTGEKEPLTNIKGSRERLKYWIYRYTPYFYLNHNKKCWW